MVGDSVEVCNEYSNSILKKRAKEFEKNNNTEFKESVSITKELKLEYYPEITYTNESILDEDVKIISSFISDHNGKRVSSCLAGENYTISIVFSTKRDIPECIAGFVIETVKGLWVINCNSIASGLKDTFPVKKDTINKIDFTFQMPKLVNGDYVVGVAISEGSVLDFKVLTWLYNVLYMQITNVGNNDGILQLDTNIEIYSKGVENE